MSLIFRNFMNFELFVIRPDIERSGQPTCIGYKRKDIEEDEEEISDETLRLSDVVTAELKSRLSVGNFGDLEHDDVGGNRRKGNNERRNRFRWYFKDLWRIAGMASRTLFLGVVLLVTPGSLIIFNHHIFLLSITSTSFLVF